jgi:RNA polymerase sigma-70 factor (ECF subfamily)
VSEPEDRLLDAARAGDEDAFRRIVEPLERQLVAHCYRMLGSLHDAEDAVQETLLRAWRGLPRFEGRSSVRAWLHRIATNVALDMAARRPKRVLPPDPGPPEAAWIEPFPDELLGDDTGLASPEAVYEQREAIELAFVAALQHLPPRQRAALILRDVLGFSAREAGEALEATAASVESALQRARAAAGERLPARSQQATLRELGDAGVRKVVERFVTAFEGGDVPAIVGLLTEDAEFAMPPHPGLASGRDAVADSWLMPERAPTGLRYARTWANGQVALGTYGWDDAAGAHLPIALDVLTLRGDLVAGVVAFRSPESFRRFGLPDALPPR